MSFVFKLLWLQNSKSVSNYYLINNKFYSFPWCSWWCDYSWTPLIQTQLLRIPHFLNSNHFTCICPSVIYYRSFKLQLLWTVFRFYWGFKVVRFNCITQWSGKHDTWLASKEHINFLQSFLWKGSFLDGWRACQYASHDCCRWDSSDERIFA